MEKSGYGYGIEPRKHKQIISDQEDGPDCSGDLLKGRIAGKEAAKSERAGKLEEG
jgi:hypothetical protein